MKYAYLETNHSAWLMLEARLNTHDEASVWMLY